MKRILIGHLAVDTCGIVLADPGVLAQFDSTTENLPDLLPPGCADLNGMVLHAAPELPFSREACWVAQSSRDRGGILGPQHSRGDERFGKGVAVGTGGDGIYAVYLEIAEESDVDYGIGAGDPARIVVDLGVPLRDAKPSREQ
jgi:hypothetical protein